tara:strand:+ start:3666 stop:4967 length:1302 start_codon:yes stop_codon:yes gene_type:complete
MAGLLKFISAGFQKSIAPTQHKKPKILKCYSDAERKLERIISNSDLVDSGRVHLLGLEALKLKLGDKWPGLRSRILENLTKIVNSHIAENDVFFSRSDDEHIVVFSRLSEAGSRLICSNILRELTEIYLGSADTDCLTVKTAVGRSKGEMLFEEKSMDSIYKDISVEEAEEEIRQASQGETKLQSASPVQELPYEVVYRPIWDVRNQAISTYMVNTQSIDRYKNISRGYEVLADPSCIEAMIGMDYMVMIDTITTMDDLFQNNFRAIFSLPICYETLFNTDMLQGFLSRCKVIPAALHKYISFTLINFPDGAPETKLRFIISSLMAYSRGVVVACDHIPQNVSYYHECGVKGLSLTYPDKPVNPTAYWKQLALFVGKCRKLHIYTALENIKTEEDLILSKEIGVNFLSGEMIGPYVDIPGHMARVTWQDLVAK